MVVVVNIVGIRLMMGSQRVQCPSTNTYLWQCLAKPQVTGIHSTSCILYKYGLAKRAIWCFMDLRQQYWPRQSISILLPPIHKAHIARHHWSIFVKCLWVHKTHIARHHWSIFVKCLWVKPHGLWIHILLDSTLHQYTVIYRNTGLVASISEPVFPFLILIYFQTEIL